MNDLVAKKINISMSSIDIAELTNKEHRHVLRDIRLMLTELYGEKSLPSFGQSYTAENGQSYNCYMLPKKEVMVLVSGYSIKLRMKIITRLEDLESRSYPQLPDFSNPVIAARAWADEIEKNMLLENKISVQAPKVAALNRIAVAEGSMNTTAAAKHLQIRPKDLFALLISEKWYYRRIGNNGYLGYQNRIQQGLIEHKVTTVSIAGVDRVYEQPRLTPKGLIKLADIINNDKLI